MRKLLGLVTVAICCGIAAPAAQAYYPFRQQCVVHYNTTSMSSPLPLGVSGVYRRLELDGTVSCNSQPASPSHFTLYLPSTSCTSATGWGEIELTMANYHATVPADFEWDAGVAQLTVSTPTGVGAVVATPSMDLNSGVCLTGLTLDGGFIYHTYAGLPWDND